MTDDSDAPAGGNVPGPVPGPRPSDDATRPLRPAAAASTADGTQAADGGPDGDTHLDHGVRGVLAIKPFRQLWLSLGLSSFGDWMGLLATTAMAGAVGAQAGYAQANLAVSAVLILRLAPAIFFGPLAGVVADRLDRKINLVAGDVLRCVLFASIAVVGELWWLFVATVLIEIIGLFWMPAKDATVPNLVPARRLEAANQLSLATTYGSAPFAALLFSGLMLLSGALNRLLGSFGDPIHLALYFNALTYLVAAAVIWRLDMPRKPEASVGRPVSVGRTITEGWTFIGSTPLIRGLVLGMLGAFGAGGFVIGVAPTFAGDLGAGPAGYGVLFACVFTGLAAGMWVGPRLLAELPRVRLFGLSIVVAGGFLALVAIIPNIVLAALFTIGLGAGGGVAWVTGYTMLGLEVADELRGRTFAFVNSMARVVLVAVMAFAPALAALIGTHSFRFTPDVVLSYNGAAFTLLFAAFLAMGIGVLAYRQMDDGRQVPLVQDVVTAWRRRHVAHPPPARREHPGFFVAFEGGDGAGKSTQVRLLARWLTDELGHEVVVTHEPGATAAGARIRQLLLHGEGMSPRAEALLFAADRAHHVSEVVRPALAAGSVVVTDRYVDSSVAYQGAGRDLGGDDVAQLSQWATEGLLPDLTVLLDVDPALARGRRASDVARGGEDRVESEGDDFHDRVRQHFLTLAARAPRRYLVLDAADGVEVLQERIRERLRQVLPLSSRQVAELQEQARLEELERERLAAVERERAERERAERERLEQERLERERQERAESERAAEQQAERERVERERSEQERAARGRAERAQAEREAAERRRAADQAGAGGAPSGRAVPAEDAPTTVLGQQQPASGRVDLDAQAEERARRAARDRDRIRVEAEARARDLARREGHDVTGVWPASAGRADAAEPVVDLADEVFGLGEEWGRR